MKKINLRPLIWITLVAVAVLSYNNVATATVDNVDYTIEANEDVTSEINNSKILLPDLALVKKVIDIAELILSRD